MATIIKTVHTVQPAFDTPKKTMLLSDFDQFIPLTHTPAVYFYRPPTSAGFLSSPLETLERSLSQALVPFYPLAGRLQWTSRDRLELNCNSEGAILILAESKSKLDDLNDFCPTRAMSSLVMPDIDYNKPIHQIPVFVAQLTEFSCGGVSLSVCISHTIVDGQAAAEFYTEWSRLARGDKHGEFTPCLDRTMLLLQPQSSNNNDEAAVPTFDHSLDFDKLPTLIGQSDPSEEMKKETTVAMLKLTKEQLKKLVDSANVNNVDRAFTRYEALAGHTWRCLCKARQLCPDQQTVFHVAVNIRDRIKPNLPKHYFGNAIMLVGSLATAGELLARPTSYASRKLRENLRKVDDQYIRSAMAYLANEDDLSKFRYSHALGTKGGAFVGNPNANMVSWSSLQGLSGTDFGWGKEIHMGVGSIGADGKSFLLTGGCHQDGSLVLAIRLQVSHMAAFKEFFYNDLSE